MIEKWCQSNVEQEEYLMTIVSSSPLKDNLNLNWNQLAECPGFEIDHENYGFPAMT